MYTYQDLLAIDPADEERRMDFVHSLIRQHEESDLYKTAQLADEYDRQENRTISRYQKFLRDDLGRLIPDNYSPNYKLASNYFNRFITQENQYLLGNGVVWQNESTKTRLGENFDSRLQQTGRFALSGGVAFGFWNYDHLEAIPVYSRDSACFAPLFDEVNGALCAGAQYWQIDGTKPLTAILHEPDGHTMYAWNRRKDNRGGQRTYREVLRKKRPYIVRRKLIGTTEAFYEYRNYPTFPIVPLWGNPRRQSEITGIRSQIDAYDLIKSGFANDLDNAQIYWILKNACGMDDAEIAQFLRRLKALGGAAVRTGGTSTGGTSTGGGSDVQPVPVNIPWESREKLLDRLERDLYRDFMALDTYHIASGAMTATQIRAAYEQLNSKADQYEYCVIEFLNGILAVAGIEDKPSFSRSAVINAQEEIQLILQAAPYLDDETVTRKIMTILGMADQTEAVLRRKAAEDAERLNAVQSKPDDKDDGNVDDNDKTESAI